MQNLSKDEMKKVMGGVKPSQCHCTCEGGIAIIIKKGLIFILVFCFCTVSCLSQVIIKGQIIDSSNSPVNIYAPINGFCNTQILKPEYRVNISRSGYFEKKLEINFPVFITIRIGLRPVYLFVEPNDTITIKINSSNFTNASPNNGIKIEGENSNGNQFFNRFNYSPIEKFLHFEGILDSLHFKETLDLKVVDYALSKIVYPFDSLLAKDEISNSFYNGVVTDIKGILLTELVKFAFFSGDMSTGKALNFVQKLYAKYPVTEQMLRSGLYQTGIAYYYYFSKARKYYPERLLRDSIYTVNGKTIFVNKDLVQWLYAPKNIQEVEWTMSLLSFKKLFGDRYGKKDVDAFLAVFPYSNMKEYLAPPYFSLSGIGPSTKDSNDFVFMPSDTLNTFASLLSMFKGKKLFVDFWATWCVPCRMEFSYNSQVDSFCKINNIHRLYVAFEISSTRENLKKIIYAYDLKGVHVVANRYMIDDIVKRFYPGAKTYNIPHYLLVNGKGEVVNSDAPRPSSGNELLNTIKADFKIIN